jgi:pyruvate-ferredoxin/flavodoxin oxidoreductase
VNVLVLDTEVYSNTGGQASKATPRGAVAKFAAAGKRTRKKDLGQIAAQYGDVYVAQVAMGADNPQTVKALAEADAYDGPSLVLAYSHCIAHGIEIAKGMQQQKLAVDTGYWPLYRYDPRHVHAGEHPMRLDSRKPKLPLTAFTEREARFAMLKRSKPEEAARFETQSQQDVDERWLVYEQLAQVEHEHAEHGDGDGDGKALDGEEPA